MATQAVAPAQETVAPADNRIYIDTQHEDLVHDAQMDFYGSKLATCSSDRTVRVYHVSETSYELAATLQGHEGPVWQVSWSHPTHGVLLASCSFDGSVWIHKEQAPGDWTVIHAARQLHESSVNGVAFGPHEYGLIVAAASSDGRVSVLRHQADQTWTVQYLEDCRAGVNAVSWAPYGAFSDPTKPDAPDFPRIVTAGCDNRIRFWVCQDGSWIQEDSPETGHSDWVRDVAWAPTLLPRENTVASCSEDKTVLIWTKSGDQHWKSTLLNTFDQPVWRVSWSVTGHLLAFSSGDNNVTLWKAGLDGTWTQVSTVEEEQQPQG